MPKPSLNRQEGRNSLLSPETVALGQGFILFRGYWQLPIMLSFCEYTKNLFLVYLSDMFREPRTDIG